MVGNYSHCAQDFGAAVAFFARKTSDFCDCGREYIRFIHAVKAVKDANRAFESHARIDVFSAQRFVYAVRPLVVLHENIVPYFKIFAPYHCRLLVARRVGVSLENGNCKPVCVKPEILVRR